ncbi:MAG: hypothetical protein HKO87_00910 [Acidimicrobiia bacterium]|nr:hypothetical protein [Acidimicrobiia bacterium]
MQPSWARLGPALFVVLSLLLLLTPRSAGAQSERERFVDVDLTLLRSVENVAVVPVRVSVLSTRAIEGTLVVEGRNSRVDWEYPIAVAANSEVTQIVMAPVTFTDVNLEASLVVGGEEVERTELRVFDDFGNENAAGLLGVAAPADSIPLTPDGGRATLIELDDLELLTALDTVVASPAGIRSLSPGELDRLLVWTTAGRQLVVAGDPGSIDGVLPPEWVSSARTVIVGSGLLHYSGSGWAEALPPGLAATTNSFEMNGFRGAEQQEILADAGFGVLGLGVLATILLAYLVIAGPVAFGVLRGMEQMTKAWVVLPGLAAVFTIGVFVAGTITTGGRTNGYASIIEVSPAGAAITDTILVADEGRRTVELPSGTTVVSSGTGIARNPGSPLVLRPTRQSTDLVFDIDPGSGGTAILARYTSDLADLLELDAVEVAGDEVTGVIRNGSGVALDNVVVVTGSHLTDIGRLDPAAETSFTLDLSEPARLDTPELRAWGVEGWFGFDGVTRDDPAVSDGPINVSSWLDWRSSRVGTAAPEGVVTAIGWSREVDASLLGGDGRSAIVARAPITNVSGPVHPDLVRSFPGHIPPGTGFEDRPMAIDGEFQPGRIHRFVRPAASDTTGLAVEVNAPVVDVQAWTDGEWSSFDLRAGGRVTVSVPDELWVDDVLWLRSLPSNVFDPSGQVVQLTRADEATQAGALLPAGVRSERSQQQSGLEPGDVERPFGVSEIGRRTEVNLDETGSFSGFGDLFRTYDVWEIDLQEGQEVSVSMHALPGGTVDPFLVVRGPTGDVVAENDDFRGLDSRVEFIAAESGVHEIEARPLGEFDQFGGYEISVLTDPPEVAG